MAAAVVNLVGDVTLVMYFGAGLAGAAAATAAASWTGTVMVLARLRQMIKPRFR
jgi:Na+-driven multidrug efflux pump